MYLSVGMSVATYVFINFLTCHIMNSGLNIHKFILHAIYKLCENVSPLIFIYFCVVLLAYSEICDCISDDSDLYFQHTSMA